MDRLIYGTRENMSAIVASKQEVPGDCHQVRVEDMELEDDRE